MKIFWLVLASGIVFTNIVNAAETNSWTTQSTEHQFGLEVKAKQILSSQATEQGAKLKSATAGTAANKNSATSLTTLKSRHSGAGLNQEFWVFDAWVTLHQDRDYDGYYHHFSLEIDADTEYVEAQLYARLYLGTNEVFNEFHVTDNFTIFGDSSNDAYVIETELLTGFPSNDYEVLIELYDAYTNELVAVYDGYDDADLYLISLESKDYDQTQVVVVHEHGGSLGLWSLLLLPALLMARVKTAKSS